MHLAEADCFDHPLTSCFPHLRAPLCAAGQEQGPGTSADDQLIALVSGHVRFMIAQDAIELRPGDELFVPAGQALSWVVGNEKAQWFVGCG